MPATGPNPAFESQERPDSEGENGSQDGYDYAARDETSKDQQDYVGTTRAEVETDTTGYRGTTRGVVDRDLPATE